MTSPLTNEERDGLVEELTSLAELNQLGGFWAIADIHRRAADKIAHDAAEITRLRAEVERKDAEIAKAADYLDALEADLIRNDADMAIDTETPPSLVGERLRAALSSTTGGRS